MQENDLLFVVIVGDHRYSIYRTGEIEGFGEDALIINRYPVLVAAEIEEFRNVLRKSACRQ
jgi:hypothetical protein